MFSVGRGEDRITIALSEGILCFQLMGDLDPRDVTIAVTLASEGGMLSPDNQILVDMRRFTGTVDWVVVRDLGRFAPWLQTQNNRQRCAYLMPDGFLSFVTILSSFFPTAKHQAFKDEAEALRWLLELRKAA